MDASQREKLVTVELSQCSAAACHSGLLVHIKTVTRGQKRTLICWEFWQQQQTACRRPHLGSTLTLAQNAQLSAAESKTENELF